MHRKALQRLAPLALVVTIAAASGAGDRVSLAAFTDAPSVGVVATMDRLDAPASVTCAGGLVICNATLLTRPQLTWTASVDPYAEGYRVLRSTGGGAFVHVATVVGRQTTTWTDNGTVSPLTTYTYALVTYAGTWTSAASTTVSVTVVL